MYQAEKLAEELKNCLEILRNGGTILYPTDTVWGLGCDATNEEAVKKIFEIKQRTESKSLIVLIEHENKLNKYVKEVPEVAWELIENIDKPLTLIYPNAKLLAKNVISDDGSVGFRVTKDEFCNKLIHKFGKPIVSTSANISGKTTPATFSEIDPEVLRKVDYIVNLRQHEKTPGHASTVIKLEMNGEFKIIRK